jgi:hypothetical protein
MSDRELLELCRLAFMATPVADEAKKVLKKLGHKTAPYAGNRSHVLARVMVEEISRHLDYGRGA